MKRDSAAHTAQARARRSTGFSTRRWYSGFTWKDEKISTSENQISDQSGAGLFFVPAAIAGRVCQQYGVMVAGSVPALRVRVYAITTERRISHPITQAISQAAQRTLSV